MASMATQIESVTEKTVIYNDISGREDIAELRTQSPLSMWLKSITLDKTVALADYNNRDLFRKVADIVLDAEVNRITGKKKRQTVIMAVPTIPEEEFKKDVEQLYLFVVNGRIVKIGGTRTGLRDRFGSYLCGHHVPQRGKSGDCSKTNGFIYNTFEFYLTLGCSVEMYAYQIPKVEIVLDNVFGRTITDGAQVFHIYESVALNQFNQMYGFNPVLSDNADPEYRTAKKEKKAKTA